MFPSGPPVGEYFHDLWLGMQRAGYSVMWFFANFGTLFTEPFFESFVRVNMPQVYTFLKPVINILEETLDPILGEQFVDLLLGPSLLDMIGLGVTLSVFALLWKKIWDMLPIV